MRPHRSRDRRRGQSLVEFSLVLIPFLFLMMGIFDLGRGIYVNNSLAEAAREIARATSVHPCDATPCTIAVGTSPETTTAIATQAKLIPGLTAAGVSISCRDDADVAVTAAACGSGKYIRVTASAPYSVITPLLSMIAPRTLSSTSTIQIP